MKQIKQIREVLKKHQGQLLKYPNVVMVGVGNKVKDGTNTGELAIIVGVSIKTAPHLLGSKELVPTQIKGHKTDVQEVGVIKKLEQTAKVRPAIPGYSVGHFTITAGTIGLKVYDLKTSEPLLLSNNHVLANEDQGKVGDAILQPGSYDGGTVANDMIATLLRWVNLTTQTSSCAAKFWNRLFPKQTLLKVDCAVGRLTSPDILVDDIAGLVKPTSVLEAAVNMPCQKSGRTTGVTAGIVQAVAVTVQVDYGAPLGVLTFEDQIAVTALSQGGDSGSAILSGDAVIGLLFAGSDNITIGNRIQNVFDALGVGLQLVAPPPPPPPPTTNPILVLVSPDGGLTWLEYAPAS